MSDDSTPDKSRDTTPDRGTTKAATEGRQSRDTSQPDFLTVAEAAQLLRVSARSIQRRCQAGSLNARLVETKFGEQWEIDRATVEKAATEARHDPRQSHDRAAPKATTEPRRVAALSHPQTEDIPAIISPVADQNAPADWKQREADFRGEIQFLRAIVEGLQQSEAQTKAALREALKAMPKALTTGTPEAAPTGPESPPARENQTDERNHAERSKAPHISPEPDEASELDFAEIEALIYKIFPQ